MTERMDDERSFLVTHYSPFRFLSVDEMRYIEYINDIYRTNKMVFFSILCSMNLIGWELMSIIAYTSQNSAL